VHNRAVVSARPSVCFTSETFESISNKFGMGDLRGEFNFGAYRPNLTLVLQ
jgi:hypothetical protein